MVIRMTLQLEEKVISYELWCIPRVSDLHRLIYSVFHLSLQSIVLKIIYSLKLLEHNDICQDVEQKSFSSKYEVNDCEIQSLAASERDQSVVKE